jgi:hypothetical protein
MMRDEFDEVTRRHEENLRRGAFFADAVAHAHSDLVAQLLLQATLQIDDGDTTGLRDHDLAVL